MAAEQGEQAGTVLWFGRFDPCYSRNRVILDLFQNLGYQVRFFRPLVSRTGRIETLVRRPDRADLIWCPCFRQTDIPAAAALARRRNIPLVIDPLISAYQKEVFERKKYPPHSPRAEQRKKWERRLFRLADLVVADTPAHADYFRDVLGADPEKTAVLHVSAEADLFRPQPLPDTKDLEVLFYGSFLPLQGVEVVIEAATLCSGSRIRWTLLGDGDMRPAMEEAAAGADNITFEPWLDYSLLPERISRAHILLGVFGTTPKADLVIPNKVFQAMAAGRPVITRTASAYRETLAGEETIGWVPPGDPDALGRLVLEWSRDKKILSQRGRASRKLFEQFFSREKMSGMLKRILDRARNRQNP